MRRLETRLDYNANHMSTWMREDLTELQAIQLPLDVSCLPRIASPVARHGQWSGRNKATDEHEEPRSSSLRRRCHFNNSHTVATL